MPKTIHPDYAKTIEKLHGDYQSQKYDGVLDLDSVIASAKPNIRAAYQVSRMPPHYQLYDLQSDPYEFRNLAGDPQYATTLSALKAKLHKWRKDTNDPLLDNNKLRKLTNEVQSVKSKKAVRKRNWNYPSYLSD